MYNQPEAGSPIEEYLSRLGAELTGMPEEQRDELLMELRQYLAALAAEQGEAAAMRRFGDPAEIGRKLLHEWQLAAGTGGRKIPEWKPEYYVQVFTG